MNTATKWILGSVVAAGTLVGILVPKGDEQPGLRFTGGMRADSLYREWEVERARLFAARRVLDRGEARVTARAVTAVRPDVPTFRFGPGLEAGATSAIEERVRGELTGARSLPTRYPIAVVAQLDTSLTGGVYTQAVVLPERAGEPCVVVISVPREQRNRFSPTATQRLLATCAFYAAFGAPGEATSRWLLETRGVSARYLRQPSAYATDTARIGLGVTYFGWDDLTESLLRCRLGVADGCDRYIGADTYNPQIWFTRAAADIDRTGLREAFPGVDVLNSRVWSNDGPRLRAGTLAALAAELGAERFGALWRDPRGLQAAYAAEEGRPFSAWVADYVAARTTPYVAGPGIPLFQVVFALAIIAAATLLAVTRSQRQMT